MKGGFFIFSWMKGIFSLDFWILIYAQIRIQISAFGFGSEPNVNILCAAAAKF
jgi:hypothetical protein